MKLLWLALLGICRTIYLAYTGSSSCQPAFTMAGRTNLSQMSLSDRFFFMRIPDLRGARLAQ